MHVCINCILWGEQLPTWLIIRSDIQYFSDYRNLYFFHLIANKINTFKVKKVHCFPSKIQM